MRRVHPLFLGAVVLAACSSDSFRDRSADSRPGGRATDTVVAAMTPKSEPSAPAARASFVGLTYQGLPAGVTYRSGAVIPKVPFDLAHVVTPRGDVVWLDSLAGGTGATPTKVVRAELSLSPLGRDERVQLGTCDVAGSLDPWVIAVVILEPDKANFIKVRQAWRANAARGAFEPIPLTGVRCDEPGGN